MNALCALELKWSDIERSINKKQNWRYPNSFWDKLCQHIFGRNRVRQRGKNNERMAQELN